MIFVANLLGFEVISKFFNNFSGALINQKQLNAYRIRFWTERNIVKGGANPGIDSGNLRLRQGPKCVQ